MPLRLPKPGGKTSVLLGFVLALGIVIALFDWNWLRHPLERYLSKTSQREVRIGDLHVDLGLSLEPTVRLRDVYIENAPWADKRPFVVAGEASITFSLRSVWDGQPVISRLTLKDAQVDLERQPDGLRNWRLRHPDDRGPGRVKLQRLEPLRTNIRFARRDADFDVTATARPSDSGTAAPVAAMLPLHIQFTGEFRGKAFSGDVQCASLLTFMETGQPFELNGHASAGKSRLDVQGSIADLFDPSAIDARMHLAGRSLAALHPFFTGSLPDSRPYEIEARVRQTQDEISFSDLQAKIGQTDLAGEFVLVRGRQRPTFRAALRSKSADLADMASLIGSHSRPNSARRGASPETKTAQDEHPDEDDPERSPTAHKRLFPTRTFHAEGLRSLDGHLTLNARSFQAAQFPTLENLQVTADLGDGVLVLKPIDIGIAGGHIAGMLKLDGRQKPLQAHAKMAFKDVQVEKLLQGMKKEAKTAGPLRGHIDLKGKGNSVAALLAAATGKIEFTMQGGGISNLLDAKLGLNGGKMLRLIIAGDRAIGIKSASVSIDFEKGRGQSRDIVLDTDQTHVQGLGIIDLHDETVDLLLTPSPKKRSLLALHKSIHVHGPIQKPQFSLVAKNEAPAAR